MVNIIKEETLDQLLTRLIAKKDNISEEQVTLEYIRQQRKEEFYPTTRYNVSSSYGGYCSHHLKFLTRQEIDERIKQEEIPLRHI
jgi:hypothetical protein